MLDKRWVHLSRTDPAYERGARNFVRTVAANLEEGIDVIICPCIDCRNLDRHSSDHVVEHLVIRGMDKTYKLRNDWYHHESVEKKPQPKCVLVDWSGTDENVAEGRVLSSDRYDFVNDNILLGPSAVKVLVETATKPNVFLWRPARGMLFIKEAVGKIIAWPAKNCVISDQPEDISPRGPTNRCKMMNWFGCDEVVGEGRWESKELKALVNGLPLGPNAVKVFVDVVHVPETFLWRPTIEMTHLKHSLMSFVAWPANKVVFEEKTTDELFQRSPLGNSDEAASAESVTTSTKTAATGCCKYPIQKSPTTTSPKGHVKKSKPPSPSPLRRSRRKKKCLYLRV